MHALKDPDDRREPGYPSLDFAVLGPVRARVGGEFVPLRSGRQRVMLALLILDAGRCVSWARLVDATWPDRAPSAPRGALHSQMMRLRRALGPVGQALCTDVEGYRLAVDPLACDLHRFRKLVSRAQFTDRPVATLREALALWRGEPFADVPSDAVAASAATLTEERLNAVERRIAGDLADGRPAEVLTELTELVGRWPLRERFWAQFMTALSQTGRPADALVAYRVARSLLRTELGIEPGLELRRTHAAVLAAMGAVSPVARQR